jgi:hypothetical protein
MDILHLTLLISLNILHIELEEATRGECKEFGVHRNKPTLYEDKHSKSHETIIVQV